MPGNIMQAVLECGCCGEVCCDRCLPKDCFTGELIICLDPVSGLETQLPVTLTVDLTATSDTPGYTCFNGSGTITFKTAPEGGVCCWEGRIEGDCVDCHGAAFPWHLDMTVCCGEAGWSVNGNPTVGSCSPDQTEIVVPTTCDPVLLEGCFALPTTSCFTACLDDVTPIPSPTFSICFSIYET